MTSSSMSAPNTVAQLSHEVIGGLPWQDATVDLGLGEAGDDVGLVARAEHRGRRGVAEQGAKRASGDDGVGKQA